MCCPVEAHSLPSHQDLISLISALSAAIMSTTASVYCPFQTYLKTGDSTFHIPIPRSFLTIGGDYTRRQRRKFRFVALTMIPDFYTQDALLLNFDSDADLALKLPYEMNVNLSVSSALYPQAGLLDVPRTATNGPGPFFTLVNQLSVTSKPDGLLKPPFFFDWTDAELEKPIETLILSGDTRGIDELMQAEALDYYGVPFDADLHSNKLPESCTSVIGSNPYLFPTNETAWPNIKERIRVRLAVSPNTQVSFSSKKMLEALGFTGLTRRLSTKRFHFVNDGANGFRYFVAESAPLTTERMEAGKMYVSPAGESVFVANKVMLTGPDRRSDDILLREVRALLRQASSKLNVELDLTYNAVTKLFAVQWPGNASVQVRLTGDPRLFETLGYGNVRFIDKTSGATPFTVTSKETSTKTKILCFDTGHVILTCPHTESKLSSISSNQYVTSLFPLASGVMQMPSDAAAVTHVVPPDLQHSNDDRVLLECRLTRFNDRSDLVPFNWICGASIFGLLIGVPPTANDDDSTH